jgi:type IV pilus assembly protein PilX
MMNFHSNRSQKGVTLVFSLVILVTLTLVGLTSMQSSQTELAMAGNQRESGLMFQAAEVGLISAENLVKTSTTNSDFTNPGSGLYTVAASDTNYDTPDYFDESKWDSSSQLVGSSIHGLDTDEQPRFIIEYLGDRDSNAGDIAVGGGYEPKSGTVVSIYRTTSRGRGLTGNSYRYVQSYYGKDAF